MEGQEFRDCLRIHTGAAGAPTPRSVCKIIKPKTSRLDMIASETDIEKPAKKWIIIDKMNE